jgi:hypothetical protein
LVTATRVSRLRRTARSVIESLGRVGHQVGMLNAACELSQVGQPVI